MSLQTLLTDHLFKRDESGRTVVYPNGVLGRGYVLPDAAAEARMRRVLGWTMIAALVLAIAGTQVLLVLFGQFGEWPYAAWGAAGAVLLAYGIAYRLIVARLVAGFVASPARLSLFEAVEKQARAMPRWYLWLMVATGALLGAGAAMMAVTAQSTADRVMGIAGFVLFAMVFVQALYGLGRRDTNGSSG